jgi:glycosyltransferase involved in cell wall biosynthesis
VATKNDAVYYAEIDPDKVVVIPLAASVLFAKSVQDYELPVARKFTGGRKYWLYVGSRLPYKNFNTLLRAFVQIANKTEEDLLVVGGGVNFDGWQQDLIVQSRLEGRVHLANGVNDNELQQAYSGASAFVFPSLIEGFGIPILEAMACGTPVILSDIDVFHEVSGNAALFFDPHSHEALAQCLLTVSGKSEELKNAGSRNASRYDWDTTAREFSAVYEALG